MTQYTHKISGVYDMKEIRKQLDKGYLNGDALLTIRWLLIQYDALKSDYDMFVKGE